MTSPDRKKLIIMPEEPFRNLVRIICGILGRERKPTLADVELDLKLLGVSPKSEFGPSAKVAMRQIREEEKWGMRAGIDTTKLERIKNLEAAEKERRRKIAEDLLRRQKEGRPEDSIEASPMADLGMGGGKGSKVTRNSGADGYPDDNLDAD